MPSNSTHISHIINLRSDSPRARPFSWCTGLTLRAFYLRGRNTATGAAAGDVDAGDGVGDGDGDGAAGAAGYHCWRMAVLKKSIVKKREGLNMPEKLGPSCRSIGLAFTCISQTLHGCEESHWSISILSSHSRGYINQMSILLRPRPPQSSRRTRMSRKCSCGQRSEGHLRLPQKSAASQRMGEFQALCLED